MKSKGPDIVQFANHTKFEELSQELNRRNVPKFKPVDKFLPVLVAVSAIALAKPCELESGLFAHDMDSRFPMQKSRSFCALVGGVNTLWHQKNHSQAFHRKRGHVRPWLFL